VSLKSMDLPWTQSVRVERMGYESEIWIESTGLGMDTQLDDSLDAYSEWK